jgi:hypothetical protein
MHQCLVAAFALACARKKRIISRLASGPRASMPCVKLPTGLIERNANLPPDRRIEFGVGIHLGGPRRGGWGWQRKASS